MWSTDTMDARVLSKEGNLYGQLFANNAYFAMIYPMDSKGKAREALKMFCAEFGVPEKLVFDGSMEQTGRKTEFMKQIRENDIDWALSKSYARNGLGSWSGSEYHIHCGTTEYTGWRRQ